MKIVLATTNAGKVAEFRALVSELRGVEVVSLGDLGDIPEVVEDRQTFEENAEKKAVTIAQATGLWALADDSGLEVDALGGEPGVYSARFAGEGASDGDNMDKLLTELEGMSSSKRSARFRCALVLADPNGKAIHRANGSCEGAIAMARRGRGGFGYDPLFQPAGISKTMAELTREEKSALSHRGEAMRAMVGFIATLIA